jgi:hypothetical protein
MCHKIVAMRGEKKEQWQQLCERAAVEQDPDKLLTLTQQINALLREKEERLLKLRTVKDGETT